MAFQVNINGETRSLDVPAEMPLLWALRNELKMVGTKFGCGVGLCGACTVHVDGVATRSCMLPISLLADRGVTTIEAMATDRIGRAVQDSWVEKDVVQCGYCQSGQIMTAVALLKETPHPTDAEIEQSMGGNICRCATYVRIREAIELAAQRLK